MILTTMTWSHTSQELLHKLKDISLMLLTICNSTFFTDRFKETQIKMES